MPRYSIAEQTYDLPRNIAIVDSNVLIAYADEHDEFHEDTKEILDSADFFWVVPHPVIVEAWNFLVGRIKKPERAYFLTSWLLTPGNAIVIRHGSDTLELDSQLSSKLQLDIVDATLMHLAHSITETCSYRPFVHVATYDTRDFFRCFGADLRFNVFDMRTLSSTAD